MHTPTLYVVRFLMVFIVVAALSMALTPPSSQVSPYLSALATISTPPAMAATCALTSCGRDKEGGYICAPTGSLTNCNRSRSGKRCSTTNC